MKLESQVISLEMARQLKELGVKQESAFYWHWGNTERWINDFGGSKEGFVPSASAFTVAELGELLPFQIEVDDHVYWMVVNQYSSGEWVYNYERTDGEEYPDGCSEFINHNEATARAKMLIHLIENKVIEP